MVLLEEGVAVDSVVEVFWALVTLGEGCRAGLPDSETFVTVFV